MADSFQPRFIDLVRNYSSTTGTANFVLGPAVAGYRSFAAEIQPGESFYYSALGVDKPAEFEVGRGTVQADGTISRQPTSGSLTDFTDGTKTIALVTAGEWFEQIQAGSAAAISAPISREALAAVVDSSKPALLQESGREGLFLFETADLSSKVALDRQQAVYVAPSFDPSGASGAWVRQFSGPLISSWFGAVGDGVADESASIQAALDYLEGAGGGEIRMTKGSFIVSGTLLVLGAGITIDATEATISSSDQASIPMVYIGGDRARIIGGTWKTTGGFGSPRPFDIEGRDVELNGAALVKEPEADGVQAYIRSSADGFTMMNCRTEGSNGIQLEASNSAILFNRFKARSAGGDDAIGIKAINKVTENIRIIGNSFENNAYFCSIGSQIGAYAANDPSYSSGVYNVVVEGNTGTACSGILYIKPGAIAGAAGSGYDYRDGTVRQVVCSNNVLRDETGMKFARGVVLTPSRGGRIIGISGSGNIIEGRTPGGSGALVGALHCYVVRNSTDGSAPALIEDVDIEISYSDPYDGASNSAAAPGFPVQYFANFELSDSSYGSMRNVVLDVTGNGCNFTGIYVGSNLDDAVYIRRAQLTNVVADGSSAFAGIQYSSRIKLGTEISIKMASGSVANAYKPIAGTTADIVSQCDFAYIGSSIPAGTDTGRVIRWAAPRNGFVHKVDIVSSSAIGKSTDDINYTQHEIRNESGSSVSITASSKLTGGQAFPANVFNTILDAANLSGTRFNDCFFGKDNRLSYVKNDFGAGNDLRDVSIRVHWAPF